MNPWLVNILACPICKHHPLRTYFFSWETSDEVIEQISKKGSKADVSDRLLEYLIREFAEGIISLPALDAIEDLSGNKTTSQLAASAKNTAIRLEKAIKSSKQSREEVLRASGPDLSLVYSYFHLISVAEGLLLCDGCDRWYPIGNRVIGVPEMLPDDLRRKGSEIAFLKKWRNYVPEKALNEGKPFNLANTSQE
ncbi:MAG: Trm112 family protein [Candidatus Hodarchaeota archaeon]